MLLGIDVLLQDQSLQSELTGKKLALLAHPASQVSSQTEKFFHSLDALMHSQLRIVSAFGPQHGMRGDKQDNMVESEDYIDPVHGIAVFSLYGKVRRLTPSMLETFDVLLIDLQDVGTRVYTFLTTLLYLLEDCSSQKTVWILDRPNPAGRPVEGSLLEPEYTSFVGCSRFPMRHGLTLGEAARWFQKNHHLDVDLKVIPMQEYTTGSPGWGWPLGTLPWINPSPNIATLSATRCYPGTVMLEGTTLSEGRETTRPLEMVGAPNLDTLLLLKNMQRLAPSWMRGCKLRPCYFLPTFQKHTGFVCSGFQMHVDDLNYQHLLFKPYRLIALYLKSIRMTYPDYPLWRDFHYEYETDRLAIDLITGSTFLRNWVDEPHASIEDFEKKQIKDEIAWEETRKEFLLYP